jgi:hypothetical protein
VNFKAVVPSFRIVCVLAVFCGTGAAARADTALPAIVREDFATQVRVGGGGVLVGLAVGSLGGRADPRAMRIPLGFGERTRICLTANTRDGLYWSDVSLTAPANTPGVGVIEPQPPWRFLEQLAQYDRTSFAAVARYGPKCEVDPLAGYLPVVYGESRTMLTAAFNSQRAITSEAHLAVPHKPAIAGICSKIPADVRATAFDVVCRFDLTGVRAEESAATLTLLRRQRTGRQRTDQFTVRLP